MHTTELPAELLLPRHMRGAKWANGVTYWSEADRRHLVERVNAAKERCGVNPTPTNAWGAASVGVRVAAYIGEPHPMCIITYGPGGCSIWETVYKPE